MDKENKLIITKPWKGNATGSIVVLIPKKIAEKTSLSNSSYVTVQDTGDGIVTIKKLNLETLL
jgi:antitoxin component of MazEF toxin-antitoxin module